MKIELSLTFFVAAGISIAPAALSHEPGLTSRQKILVDFMTSQHVQDRFLMLDKQQGEMLAIDQGRIAFRVPALSSAVRGDDMQAEPGVTPAGIFPLTISPNPEAHDAAILYLQIGPQLGYAIHKYVLASGGQRKERLQSRAGFTNPDLDRRITAACINLLERDYLRVSQFASQSITHVTDVHGKAHRLDSVLLIAPEAGPDEEVVSRIQKLMPRQKGYE